MTPRVNSVIRSSTSTGVPAAASASRRSSHRVGADPSAAAAAVAASGAPPPSSAWTTRNTVSVVGKPERKGCISRRAEAWRGSGTTKSISSLMGVPKWRSIAASRGASTRTVTARTSAGLTRTTRRRPKR